MLKSSVTEVEVQNWQISSALLWRI